MWLIVGLGNPGSRYSKTRHNVGFEVVDRLSSSRGIPLRPYDLFSSGKGHIGGIEVILLKPLTFMNKSGIAVREALYKYSIALEKTIVVHDDLDLELGLIRLKKNGGSGGHRGIESIIVETGSRDFIRVKIGIGRDSLVPPDVYVLSRFNSSETERIESSLSQAESAIESIVVEGIEHAMNRFNRKNPKMPNTLN